METVPTRTAIVFRRRRSGNTPAGPERRPRMALATTGNCLRAIALSVRRLRQCVAANGPIPMVCSISPWKPVGMVFTTDTAQNCPEERTPLWTCFNGGMASFAWRLLDYDGYNARSAYRHWLTPDYRSIFVGFRLRGPSKDSWICLLLLGVRCGAFRSCFDRGRERRRAVGTRANGTRENRVGTPERSRRESGPEGPRRAFAGMLS